jgi:hypothetical protein
MIMRKHGNNAIWLTTSFLHNSSVSLSGFSTAELRGQLRDIGRIYSD